MAHKTTTGKLWTQTAIDFAAPVAEPTPNYRYDFHLDVRLGNVTRSVLFTAHTHPYGSLAEAGAGCRGHSDPIFTGRLGQGRKTHTVSMGVYYVGNSDADVTAYALKHRIDRRQVQTDENGNYWALSFWCLILNSQGRIFGFVADKAATSEHNAENWYKA